MPRPGRLSKYGEIAVTDEGSAPIGTQQSETNRLPVNWTEMDGRTLALTVALIGAGVLIEPELLGGVLLGAGVMYGLPLVGRLLQPVAKNAIGIGYTAVRTVGDTMSTAGRTVGDAMSTAGRTVTGAVSSAGREMQRMVGGAGSGQDESPIVTPTGLSRD
jgi:hypothetical protein